MNGQRRSNSSTRKGILTAVASATAMRQSDGCGRLSSVAIHTQEALLCADGGEINLTRA